MLAWCRSLLRVTGLLGLWSALTIAARSADAPPAIPIAKLDRATPVDFGREVLPLFKRSCLACHNASKAENGVVLESPTTIRNGGDSGPLVAPGHGADSTLVKAASRQSESPMPPPDNKVGAMPLSSEELGLLQLWIDQGATGSDGPAAGPLAWQPLPPGINPILAVALSPDGQYAACGRANQIFLYHLASGQVVTRLSDPATNAAGPNQNRGVAHLDLVHALAFNPEGDLLASGGYREVKLWRRLRDVRKLDLPAGEQPVAAVAASADGAWAALGDSAGTIRIVSLMDGKETKRLTGHTAAIAGLAILPGGGRLASVSLDKTIRLWNVADGALLANVEAPSPLNALAVLADGAMLASGGADNLLRTWSLDPNTGALAAVGQIAGHSQSVTAVAAVPADKNLVVSGSADGTVRVWNLQNGQQQRQFDHGGPVAAIAVRGDSKQLASVGGTNLVRLWNLENGQPWTTPSGQPAPEMKGDQRAQLRVAKVERDASRLTNRVADTKKAVTEAEMRVTATAEAIKMAQQGKEAADKALVEKQAAAKPLVEAKDNAAKELEAAKAAAAAASEKAAQAKAAAEKDAGNADLAKANDEARKAAEEIDRKLKEAEKKLKEATKPANKAVREVNTAQASAMAAEQAIASAMTTAQKAVEAVPLAKAAVQAAEAALALAQQTLEAAKQAAAAGEKPLRAVAYSPDGSQLATGGDNQIVRTWSSQSGQPLESFAGPAGTVQALALLPGGNVLAAAADKTAIVWDAGAAWKLERTIGQVDDPAALVDRVLALAFSPDGKLLATGGGEPSRSGELKLWNVADGQLVRAVPDAHSDTIFGLEFSPEGNYLASGAADRFAKVFEVATGTQFRSFEGHTHHVLGVSWRADGKLLATCGADNVLKVWDVLQGEQKLTSPALGKEMTGIAFAGDASRVLVASGDKNVRFYNVDNGNAERTYGGSGDYLFALAVTPDGKLVAAGGQDSVLRVWNVENTQLVLALEPPKGKE